MEFMVVLFKIAENVERMSSQQEEYLGRIYSHAKDSANE